MTRAQFRMVEDVRSEAQGFTGRNVLVGVIDSGWDRKQCDFRVQRGYGFVAADDELSLNESSDDHDRIGHGTMCTSIILDIAPHCRLLPLRIFGDRLETSLPMLVAAIDTALNHRVKVLNLSLGTLRPDLAPSLFAACDRAARAGTIIVAAGRAGRSPASYPAIFEPVIGVRSAALESLYAIRYDPETAIECAVRTTRRCARGLDGVVRTVSGTSFGAPLVSGLIARWAEAYPDLNLAQVRSLLAGKRISLAVDEGIRD